MTEQQKTIPILAAANESAHRMSLWFAAIGAISIFVVSSATITYGLHQRSAAAVQAMSPYLRQLLKTNDVFDATRQLNSLISSKTFSGFWLIDAHTDQVITTGVSSTSDRAAPVTNSNWSIKFRESRPELIATFALGDTITAPDYRLIVSSRIPLLPIAGALFLLMTSWAGFYYAIRRRMQSFAAGISAPITDFACALNAHSTDGKQSFTPPITSTRYTELADMGEQFKSLLSRLNQSEEKRRNVEKEAALANQARETAHNLKSPILALEIAVSTLEGVPEKTRVIIRSAVNSIRDIANCLMSKYDELNKTPTLIPTGHSIPSFRMRTHLLSSLIEEIITERRMQFRARTDIQIESNLGPASYGLFATIDPVEFKNAITNLIINSVEASNNGGQISVEMQSTAGGFIEITVTDKGCGIPEEILPRLMRKGASFGKSNGHGIGLYHARKAIESWNGTIRIDSTPDKGTRVFILLPKAEPPKWFVPELKVTPNTEVVVIDDDPSIHEVWKERLNGIRLHHFQSPDSVIAWHQARANTTATEALWLVDYEFIGNSKNGLELIELLGVQQRSVLVTSHFDDRDVLEGCKRSSVRMLPKTLAGWVGVRGIPVSDT